MMNVLLYQVFSPNALDALSSPPLGIAVTGASPNIVQLLVWGGADLSLIDPVLRQTPLDYVVQNGGSSLRRIFIKTLIDQSPADQTRLSQLLTLTISSVQQPEALFDSGAEDSLNMQHFMRLSKMTPLAYLSKYIRMSLSSKNPLSAYGA